jgi:hypothetical protein
MLVSGSAYPVNASGPPTTAVISGPSESKTLQEVAAVGFEPSSADISVASRSRRCRIELSTAVRFCITDQASLAMIARWAHMGNTAHPVPTRNS